MIGIIGALKEEVFGLIQRLSNTENCRVAGIDFSCGTLFEKRVVVAQCGIGKVNASMAASFMLATYPDIKAIINIGVAGGIQKDIKQGEVIVASSSLQHDFNLNSDLIPVGQIFDFVEFVSHPYLVCLAEHILKQKKISYHTGVIASGDEFINSNKKAQYIASHFGAIACDMESAAIAHVCYKAEVKFLSVRCASDNGDDNADKDIVNFLLKAANISIDFSLDFVRAIDISKF